MHHVDNNQLQISTLFTLTCCDVSVTQVGVNARTWNLFLLETNRLPCHVLIDYYNNRLINQLTCPLILFVVELIDK